MSLQIKESAVSIRRNLKISEQLLEIILMLGLTTIADVFDLRNFKLNAIWLNKKYGYV